MPRIGRVVAVGLPHHVTQRGNYKNDVFEDDIDRQTYLTYICESSRKFHFTILAYCLMSNHIHFIGIPHEENSLAKVFNTTHMRYSQYFNKKRGLRGHLWQGRFFSCILDEKHLIAAARYIERNPVRAKLIKDPWGWEYSSARAHIGEKEKFLLSVNRFYDYAEFDEKGWRDYISKEDSLEDKDKIMMYTKSGRPLGSGNFVAGLEKKLNRRLHALSWGRPKK